jgi:hypothetical protein
MAVGAFLAPTLVDWFGLRGAMAITGAIPLLVGLSRLPRMRGLDRRLTTPTEPELLGDDAVARAESIRGSTDDASPRDS